MPGFRISFCTLVAGILLAMLALAAPAQRESPQAGLPNFHQINPQLYRGGQPRAGRLRVLKDLGIKTIVNLRGEDNSTRAENQEANSLGLQYFSLSLRQFSRPKDKDVKRVLAIINAPENQPVFIHCHHGKDRTGVIVACYRISHDGWSAEQAKDEAGRYGLGWIEIGMRHYIDNYYARYKTKKSGVGTATIRK